MSNTPMAMFAVPTGVPAIDVNENLRIALNSGRRTTAVLEEMLALQLTSCRRPNTYTTSSRTRG